ncbi:MAG: hypothetical protein ACRCSG_01760, partial [Cellulosilyticaceae bacterium]
WYKTQDNFVGIDERMKYTSQKIIFEYALNKWFGTTFSQPPLVSPIYIVNNNNTGVFLVSETSINTSQVGLYDSDTFDFVGLEPNYYETNTFTINYPSTLPTILSITTQLLEQQIANIADKIKISGTTYNIQSY